MKKLGGLLFVFLFLSIIMLGCQFKPEQQTGVIIQNIQVNGLKENKPYVSFKIKNFNNFTVDCYGKISFDNKTTLSGIGIVKPGIKEEKQISLNSITDANVKIKIEPICRGMSDLVVQKCGNIKTYTDRILCEFELKNPRVKQCYGRETGAGKLFCAALVTNNPKICNYIVSYKRHWCTAYITGNFSYCDKITDQDKKDWCYMDIGMNKGNKNICEKISDSAKKTSCMAVISSDANACLKGSKQDELICILNIIEIMGDKSLCEKLGDSKTECYSSLEG